MVGTYKLQPGDYVVQQVTPTSNPRVLEFLSGDEMRSYFTITAIPVLRNDAPSESRVVLQDEAGGIVRLYRIWVQGRNYGYEIPGHAVAVQVAAGTLEGHYTPEAPAEERVAEAPPAPEAPPEAPPEQPAPPAPAPPPVLPATDLGWANLALAGIALLTAGVFLSWRASSTAILR